MVELPESFRAFVFQSEIDNVRDSFRVAVKALEQALQGAIVEHAAYIASGEDDSEYDEDGALVQSTRHQLEYATREAGEALRIVREAFITSAFHYWERATRAWFNLHGRNHTFTALKRASAARYGVSGELEALNHLNNVIKHGSAHHARELASLRIDLFRQAPYCILSSRRESWSLHLTNATVEEVFEIIKRSGPR